MWEDPFIYVGGRRTCSPRVSKEEAAHRGVSLSVRNSVSQEDPLHHIVAYTRLWPEG